MNRWTKVAAVALVQLACVGFAVAPQLSARTTGEDFLMDVTPVDPIDPFRGAYVQLGYPGLPETRSADGPARDVYVPLEKSGSVWRGVGIETERPDGPPYLTCRDEHWRLRCGIESLFLPQDEAVAMEQTLRDGAVARVRIDGRGNAAVLEVLPAP